jgi:hypothetical protein
MNDAKKIEIKKEKKKRDRLLRLYPSEGDESAKGIGGANR